MNLNGLQNLSARRYYSAPERPWQLRANNVAGPITIGADPELFLKDNEGRYISSIGKFGGSKLEPRPFCADGFFIQEDNVALEFNIPPANNKGAFRDSILQALRACEEEARERGLIVAIDASAEFDPDQLANPIAQQAGCDPDYNVWTMQQNPTPSLQGSNLRVAGGHIHIGYIHDFIGLGRACDLYLGVPSIIYDQDVRRRTLYGRPGSIRIKDYGVEYRVLSNAWMKSTDTIELVYEQVQRAINFVERNEQIPEDDVVLIHRAILKMDFDAMRQLTEKYNLWF